MCSTRLKQQEKKQKKKTSKPPVGTFMKSRMTPSLSPIKEVRLSASVSLTFATKASSESRACFSTMVQGRWARSYISLPE